MISINSAIKILQPGGTIEISRTSMGHCTAERSGDGQWVLFIRYTSDIEWVVFKKIKFQSLFDHTSY